MAVDVAGPPQLVGYRHIRRLGRGGFADVYLYEQFRPKREVAIKVLFPGADAAAIDQFTAEADVMAQLSSHASILPVYEVGTAGDGRPYFAMEYCPGPNLAVRSRAERIGVPEALSIGIQIAGAVETAHRAGILHRDIKPHNILSNAFNRPKLTDFGVAHAAAGPGSETGVSIPWAAPELLRGGQAFDVRGDVYALGATIYTMLAGRSPFEISGGANDNAAMMRRIMRAGVPAIGRDDIPEALNDVLALALAKTPGERYESALDMARGLQRIQISLELATTSPEVLEPTIPVVDGERADARTRVRPIAVIRPDDVSDVAQRASSESRAAEPRMAEPLPSWIVPEEDPDPPAAATSGPPVDRPDAEHGDETESAAPPKRTARSVLVAVPVLVVGLAVGSAFWLGSGADETTGPADGRDSGGGAVPPTSRPPAPTDVEGERTGDTVEFTWTHPSPADGDRYQWRFTEEGGDAQWSYVDEPRLEATVPGGVNGCVSVSTVRGGHASEPVGACPEGD